jgi:single-strand DNA-binding protein
MNVLTITGNLGKDVRLGSAGGTAVANFSVAVRSGYGDKEQTIWVDCSLWGKQAESKLTDYLLKGQQVAVSGEMGTREHEGKTYITLRVSSVDLIGKKGDAPAPAAENKPAPAKPAATAATNDSDDIPF